MLPGGGSPAFFIALSLKRSLTLKKLIIKSKRVADLLSALSGRDNTETLTILNKARGHKYIRRWPAKNGKGWEYLYPEDFLHPVKALLNLFSLKKEKIEDDYTKNNIKKDYGANKKTFAAHVLEYFSNKLKWDTFFANKENRDKYKAPQKPSGKVTKKTGGSAGAGTGAGAAGPGGVLGDPDGGGGKKGVDNDKKEGDNKGVAVNKSLMRRIWGIYNGKDGKDGTDQPGSGQGKLPATPETVQPGRTEDKGNQHGDSTVHGEADNGRDALQLPGLSGERSGRDVRVTKKQAKDIRQACLDLLNSKSDSEMTDEDKDLLRQYEGAGGLGSEDASVHGTLYEFYTPRTVTKKVWEIVDKYIPGAKNVLEPSAGIGRFAEDRPSDKFTLNEYDQISSRISGILHPDAEIKHGAFQEMFKPGKDYAGKKYDVVIGNPPYGKYEGIWKGRGEGKGHTRYEEYFIDRGLDTLREGGIMAFVVPSSFLRGGNDKIKERIAVKGKLMEAWRLPNGTFNTTGVGTDIIIVRKEKGDPAAFSNNTYFEQNPLMVAGDETTRTGRFGEEKYVGLKDGETFDEAIEGINTGAVEAAPIGEQTTKEQLNEKTKVIESEAEKHKNRSDAMKGNENAKKDGGAGDEPPTPPPGAVDTLEEFNLKYNKHFDPQDLKIMRHTRWDGTIDLSLIGPEELKYMKSSGNYVDIGDNAWMSVANFASGNIYQKLDDLENAKGDIPTAEYKRQKNLLEAALPAKKTVFDFTVSPISDFSEEYKIETLNGPESLNGAFKRWLWDLDSSNIPNEITRNDILDYVNRKAVRAERSGDKVAAQLERAQTVRVRREAAENLFNQFIREQLSVQEQERMADKWNRQFNGTVQPDHTKIPVFVDGISKTFKDKPLKVSEIQLKGVGTLVNRGNGILAYDVGVGKTLAGILATVSQIQTGRAKRPLICVPKAVYKNWISEIKQLFPGIKINELNNLRSLGDYKNTDGSLNIPEGSLSVCTYEGLQAISFEKETIDNVLMADFTSSQQSTGEDDSQRKQAQELEKIRTALGKATKSTDNSVLWENTGFDHITIDEMHNFKNVIGGARAKEKGEANEFQGLTGGAPAERAMKAFAITQLIQRDNNGRNVFGLTATPFTNSPIEIYNILSLVARAELKQAGIFNIHEFMAQFALLKSELSQTAKGDVELRTVMKEFKNLPALQNLINTYIDKVDGEEAGIIRPNKTQHLVDINMSEEQKAVYEDIIHYMDTANPKEDPGAMLRGLNALRALTVSPALLKETRFANSLSGETDFVRSSPKMTFVCDSVATLYKDQPKKRTGDILAGGCRVFQGCKKIPCEKGYPRRCGSVSLPGISTRRGQGKRQERGDHAGLQRSQRED
jgi:SNF2 family DNA or RNA helicase